MLLQAEATLLQCVEEGNFGYQEISEKLRKFSGYLSDTGDSLRDGKNSVIVFAALCSRAAVRGGMPAQTSRELETDYLNRIEACRTIPQLAGSGADGAAVVSALFAADDCEAAARELRAVCDKTFR